MIQACIRLISHIIQGKVWNRRIQVFSKLVEIVQNTLDCTQVGPNMVTALPTSLWEHRDPSLKGVVAIHDKTKQSIAHKSGRRGWLGEKKEKT